MSERNSGLLLHITSLPGKEGIGTIGSEAYRFIDFLERTGQKFWQILPLGQPGDGNSPYQCYSAFAGNPMLIDIFRLIKDSLLNEHDLRHKPQFSENHVDFKKVRDWKSLLLKKAFENFQNKKNAELENELNLFLKENDWWIKDYSLFMAAKIYFKNTKWDEWENDLKFRKKSGLSKYEKILSGEIDLQKFIQFLFFRQWFQLKEYARSKRVVIFGDLPLYVSGDSADVWSNTDIFDLDKNLKPQRVGGVPPDYFSETGQLWGNPVYDWQQLKKRKFDWWIDRLHFNLNLFDLIRIDHFRGLESYWSVPADEKTAIKGEWKSAEGYQLLKILNKQIGHLPLVAEDLGKITPEVEQLRNYFKLPGMKVLQFAFNSDEKNKNLPLNYTPGFIAYTGTHDNNTTLGWLRTIKDKEKKMATRYLGDINNKRRLKKGIDMIWSSCTETVILPVQDLLMLGSKARLNTPGTSTDNWSWRLQWRKLKPKHERFLINITQKYNRFCSTTP